MQNPSSGSVQLEQAYFQSLESKQNSKNMDLNTTTQ